MSFETRAAACRESDAEFHRVPIGGSLDSARRSIAHTITNNRIAQEMSISLRSIELHRANMAGRRS
ncbi:hypothetical protein ASS64_15120 [Erythrobacter sp. AP23]|nr:hypothetical protein ASS64_15120 [Erythrobacter sp. AP23]